MSDTAQNTPGGDAPDLETWRKRLKFRAWHRGTQEADLIIGSYFDTFGWDFDGEACAVFEALLEETDQDILNWLTGKEVAPAHVDSDLIARMARLDYLPVKK